MDAQTTESAQPLGKPARNLSIDRARTFLTVVVLIHHSVIPYTYFGHTDATSWLGFDAIVLANDSFFMAMFFFLSGLFVWPALAHRKRGEFTRDRLLRLGLPFVIGALTVIPLAYYSYEPRDSAETFGSFWWRMVTVGPWPAGPIWFTWVLLVFGIVAALVFRGAPHAIDPINRLSQRGFTKPGTFFAGLVAITAIVYVPAFLYYGPGHWFALGPIAVQASRVGLYLAYFVFGIGVGAAHMQTGLLSPDGALSRHWAVWSLLTLLSYAVLWALIAVKRGLLGNPGDLPNWYEFVYGIVFVVFSAAMMFFLLGVFLKFKQGGKSILDLLQRDAYGIFLVHYPFVLWIAYWLHPVEMSAIVKAAIVFSGGLLLSWATSASLRRIPGAEKVL